MSFRPARARRAAATSSWIALLLVAVPAVWWPGTAAGGALTRGDSIPGIWTSRAELAALPAAGASWDQIEHVARLSIPKPNLSDQNDPANAIVLAKALVSVRIGDAGYRKEVIEAIRAAMGTETGGRTLSLGRKLVTYVIAAELVRLGPEDDKNFRAFLRQAVDERLDGRTLISTNEERPNNWGTHAGASRAAIAVYLKDRKQLERVARVFKGYLGDRDAYSGFKYRDLSWQADPDKPVGINPKGATRDGHSIDGVLPDDQRRAGGYVWPPPQENYVYEALQGAITQAVILSRAGYDVWSWQDQALLRAYKWLREQVGYAARGDDTWQLPIVDHFYGTDFWDGAPTRPGKGMGFTDWLYSRKVARHASQ